MSFFFLYKVNRNERFFTKLFDNDISYSLHMKLNFTKFQGDNCEVLGSKIKSNL